MEGVAGVVRSVLTPRVGASLAEMTVRATAISLGKSSEDLDSNDLPALIERARQMLSGVATTAHIDAAVAEIQTQARAL